MKITGDNYQRTLEFSNDLLPSIVVFDEGHLSLDGSAIVVNLGAKTAFIDGFEKEHILPMTSTKLSNVDVFGSGLLLFFDTEKLVSAEELCKKAQWSNFFKKTKKDNEINLWCSPQDVTSEISIDFSSPYISKKSTLDKVEHNPRFFVKTNLWFASAGTHCQIHREHSFIEIHTQIFGFGHMQKFREKSFNTLYEDIGMCPGFTTNRPFCSISSLTKFEYPWHQYYAETDCIWLAVEYHPIIGE
ncbi:hypothetical protein ABLA30_04600 [Xenorhabdus nematophila]|uniref:hypothetical protein n=1 Tax=Xenorhabdus nematophila TaxID=628 RepID=UPI0003275AF8|nr:hypothetical protein [Xenorhabdus nematophila]CCW31690.1 conserved hypothetical protein [Xenorhabdus nematophila F1]